MVASDLVHASDGDSNTQHLLLRHEDTLNDTTFSESMTEVGICNSSARMWKFVDTHT